MIEVFLFGIVLGVFWLMLFGSYLALGLLGSRNIF